MTNLVPGSLFSTPGLNRNFTPTPNTVTPKDLDKIYARQPFNGHSWPPDSPVTRVYDVSNTSTRMIVLNNKNQKASRLRGYDETESTRVPDPGRHSRASSAKNPRAHRNCYDSSSPYFVPEIETNLDWLNSNNQRTQTLDTTSMKSFSSYTTAKSAVNPKRHTSCKVPTDPPEFSTGMSSPILRRRRFHPPRSSMIFNYPEMAPGEKLYLWSMERIYSAKNLMALKKDQYLQLLQRNSRGVHSFHEYLKYMNYIKRPKTAPIPTKTGWSRPLSPAKSVNSVESTKDNSQKQETSDKKTRPSSEVSQKSQSDQSESSKSKKQVKSEQEKSESNKVGISSAQAATGLWSPPRSKQNSLRSRNGSARSQTSSGSQEGSQREKDENAKDEPKQAMENKAEEEEKGEGSDKLSFSEDENDENDEKKTKDKEGVDRPLSRHGHVSPKGSVQDQKPTDVKQEEAADDMDKTSQEHDSRPSTVLSVHEHVERPESGKSTSSKDKDVETQLKVNKEEEKSGKSSNKAESLVSIRSNDNQQISRARRDSADKDNNERAHKDEHRARRDSGGEDSPREGNKEIHGARRDEEKEDYKGETKRGSGEIHGAQRDKESEDDKGEAKRSSGEIHRARRDSFDADDDRRGNRDLESIEN
ncbi:hypothetical protein CHS0354_019968 [Potamilus streckersoni]|uniref:Uncharacterized protein n=1 Tax=Potamilus streckersoni TaxID=2493646 RepID=A0AAE0VLS5_9BIVA|nr:hypothetical protein CHS0354_019968 [Potamilus streckersoni]